MKKLSRLTPLLLALMMLVSMLPASALASAYPLKDYQNALSEVQTFGLMNSAYEYYVEQLAAMGAQERFETLQSWYDGLLGDLFYGRFIEYYEEAHPGEDLICTCDQPLAHGGIDHDAQCGWSFANLPEEEKLAVLGGLNESELTEYIAALPTQEAYLSDGNVSVHGEVPVGAKLSAKALSDIFGNEAGDGLLAYDVKVQWNGFDWQPRTALEMTAQNAWDTSFENPYVEVVHVLDTADAVLAAQADGTLKTLEDAEAVAFYPEEAAAAQAAGIGAVVPYTLLSSENGEVALHADGSVSFAATSFSDYYIASGDMSEGNRENRGEIVNGTNDVYYTMPGTTLYFYVDINNNVRWTADLPDGVTGNDDAEYENNPAYQITISENFVPAADGTEFTLTAQWYNRQNDEMYRGQVTIVVLSTQEFVNKILTAPGDDDGDFDNYPVYVAVLQNSATFTGIPAEPGQSGAGYDCVDVNYELHWNPFAPNGAGIISSDFGSHAGLRSSVDGTNTIGIVDPTGETTKSLIVGGIDWERLKTVIFDARNGTWYDTDGDVVDEDKIEDYEIIPYVIKLETTNDLQGWHIDCAVRKKNDVTLTYFNNIPGGMELETDIKLPNNVTAEKGKEVTVGGITGLDDSGAVEVSVITNPDEKYTFTFVEWNTKPDGTGVSYDPGDPITLNENTVLYAIWDTNLGTGDLLIRKTVVPQEGGAIEADKEFTFTVTIDNAPADATYRYITYRNDVAVTGGAGTIASGGTLKLTHGQYVIIKNLPIPDEESTESNNVTVTETAAKGYTASWDGGATENSSTAVEIKGGIRSEITCTNTQQPTTATLTITKAAAEGTTIGSNESFIFTVVETNDGAEVAKYTVTIQGTGSVKISGLTVGNKVTVTEDTAWSSRYTPVGGATRTIDSLSNVNELTFTNQKGNDKWLGSETSVTNEFDTIESDSN